VLANEVPGTAHEVMIAANEDEAETEEIVEAEDLDAQLLDDSEEDLTNTDDIEVALLQFHGEDAEEDSEEDEEDEEEEDSEDEESEEESDDESEAEDADEEESEDEEDAEEDDEEDSESEDSEDAEDATADALVESTAASAPLLSVPEAEAHHLLIDVQGPAMVFLQVADELDVNDDFENAGAEISDSADTVELEDSTAQISDSADNGEELVGEGWGDEYSNSDPYAFVQLEELLYADTDNADASPLVDAPVNAVTSTSETAAQIHAELDEAANLDSASELQAQALGNAGDAAEADTDTSDEMEVDAYGEGVWSGDAPKTVA